MQARSQKAAMSHSRQNRVPRMDPTESVGWKADIGKPGSRAQAEAKPSHHGPLAEDASTQWSEPMPFRESQRCSGE